MYRKVCCPVCGSNLSKSYDKSLNYENKRCENCSTVYLAWKSDVQGFSNIYNADYYQSSSHQFGYEDYQSLRQAIYKTAHRRFLRIEQFVTAKERSLLDVGCALGYYLEEAQKMGWKVRGIDISDWAISKAEPALKSFLICDNITSTDKLPENYFDCITLWDIIEQTPEPAAILKSCARFLKKGGLLVLLFRDIDSLCSKALKKKWVHYRPEEKYVYLTKKSASLMLSRTGYEILAMEFTNTGKDTTFVNLAQKVETYNRLFSKGLRGASKLLGISDKTVHLNFYDSRIVYAQKL